MKSAIQTLKDLAATNEHVLESLPGRDSQDDEPVSKCSVLFLVEI